MRKAIICIFWPQWGRRSNLFISDKGMLLGNGRLLPEEKLKDFQTPPATLPRSPGSNFQYSGWTTEANHLGNVAYRTGKKIAAPFIKRPEYRK